MNCKQGDLAIIINGTERRYAGKVVKCLVLLKNNEWIFPDGRSVYADGWKIDVKLEGWDESLTDNILDSWLKPIRDQDGEDEMLRIAGKPERMTA